MSVSETTAISGKTKLADLTLDDLRALMRAELKDFIRAMVQEALDEYDPDEGLEFSEETKQRLTEYLREKPEGIPAEEVMRELGLMSGQG